MELEYDVKYLKENIGSFQAMVGRHNGSFDQQLKELNQKLDLLANAGGVFFREEPKKTVLVNKYEHQAITQERSPKTRSTK